jgi:hypothetical protein
LINSAIMNANPRLPVPAGPAPKRASLVGSAALGLAAFLIPAACSKAPEEKPAAPAAALTLSVEPALPAPDPAAPDPDAAAAALRARFEEAAAQRARLEEQEAVRRARMEAEAAVQRERLQPSAPGMASPPAAVPDPKDL